MKVLVLTAFYPIPNGTHERMFIHVRNQYYNNCGINVTVLNFDAKENYVINGIKVITSEEFDTKDYKTFYDVVIIHSANLRNHYLWLKKYQSKYDHFVFFFHGHEVLYLNKDYPKPYPFMSKSKWYHQMLQNTYDWLKLKVWGSYYKKISYKSEFVFVSNWIHKHFLLNTGLSDNMLNNRIHIINNSVGEIFEKRDYDIKHKKQYDFITIRSNLDGSKYCIDLVVRHALNNPESTFLVIGKGKYFKYNEIPANMTVINNTLNHEDMIEYINQAKCALMPTREDTQGVMTCELATLGIPVITSDIEVCQEFFEHLPNVSMVNNDDNTIDISMIGNDLFEGCPYEKITQFAKDNTISKEVKLFEELIGR